MPEARITMNTLHSENIIPSKQAALDIYSSFLDIYKHLEHKGAGYIIERIASIQVFLYTLAQAQTTGEITEAIMTDGLETIQASAGLLIAVADNGKAMTTLGRSGCPEKLVHALENLTDTRSTPFTDVIQSRQMIFLQSDEECHTRYPALGNMLALAGSGAMAFIPLIEQDRVTHILMLNFPQGFILGEEHHAFFTLFAGHCTQAMRRAKLYDTLQAELQERKRIEHELITSRQRFRATFEQAAVGIVYTDLHGIFQDVNWKFAEIIGYSREELIGMDFKDITYPDDIDISMDLLHECLTGDKPSYSFDKRYIRKDGGVVWVNLTVSFIHGTKDNAGYFISIVNNISVRKYAEEEAKERARQLSAIIESMSDTVILYDRQGIIQMVNSSAMEVLEVDSPDMLIGIAAEEFTDMFPPYFEEHKIDLIPHEQRPTWRILHGEKIYGAKAIEMSIRTRKGNLKSISVVGSPIYDEQGHINGAVVVARDVTEKRKLEKHTLDAFNTLLEMTRVLVTGSPEHESYGRPKHGNDVARRMLELAGNVLGSPRASIYSFDAETHTAIPMAITGLSEEQEDQWWSTGGTFGKDPFLVHYLENLQSGEMFRIDMTRPPFSAYPNLYRVSEMLIVPMRMKSKTLGFLTFDYSGRINEHSRIETELIKALAKLGAAIVESERLFQERETARANEFILSEANRRMDEFLSIASHELKTPLTSAKANVQLANRRMKNLSSSLIGCTHISSESLAPIQELLSRADNQINRQSMLINDLLDLSRIQTGNLQLRTSPCDLVEIVQDTIDEQRLSLPDREISLSSPCRTCMPVMADPDRLGQVLTNYLSNAIKYSPEDQPIIVKLEHDDTTAKVSVIDKGRGLTPDQQQQVWGRFYRVHTSEGKDTLAPECEGLGLGLYISKSIIEQHNGQVGVESTLGAGSTFWFSLPEIADPPPSPSV